MVAGIIERNGTHSSIPCHEADLREGVFKSNVLGCLSVTHIGFVVPPGQGLIERKRELSRDLLRPLWDLGDDQTSRNIWNPVCELHPIRVIVDI